MYIQVTTRCNMRCAHCMFACGPRRGKDMSLETFRRAFDMAQLYGANVGIGGGEPTLNPHIIMMLGYASLLSDHDMAPFMVTNGTCDESTWNVLMKARLQGNLDVRVSKDPWHDEDMIQPWVWDDADRHELWWGDKYTRKIVTRGRARGNVTKLKREALDWGYYDRVSIEKSDCPDVRVSPDGMVWADTNKATKVGPLSEQSMDAAHEVVSKYDEESW